MTKIDSVASRESTAEKPTSFLNIFTDPEKTTAALVVMEGTDWLEEMDQLSAHSIKGAIQAARESSSEMQPGTIYGLAGYSRYYVYSDGRIKYSNFHGPENTPKAQSLGFEILQ